MEIISSSHSSFYPYYLNFIRSAADGFNELPLRYENACSALDAKCVASNELLIVFHFFFHAFNLFLSHRALT
jgi:hypothetical protein